MILCPLASYPRDIFYLRLATTSGRAKSHKRNREFDIYKLHLIRYEAKFNAKSIFHRVLNIFDITRNEPAIGKADWTSLCYIESLTMAKCSYCDGYFVLFYFCRATKSTCIILGDTCEFYRVNSSLKFSEIDSVVCHIRCYILFRLRTIVPPISEYGKIYMGILCGFCC